MSHLRFRGFTFSLTCLVTDNVILHLEPQMTFLFTEYFMFFSPCSGDYSNALLHYEKGITKLPEVSRMAGLDFLFGVFPVEIFVLESFHTTKISGIVKVIGALPETQILIPVLNESFYCKIAIDFVTSKNNGCLYGFHILLLAKLNCFLSQKREHDELCVGGMARMAIRVGDIRRFVKIKLTSTI